MLVVGTNLINGAALWKIILVSLVCGSGAAIAFGLLLVGLSRSRGEGSSGSTGDRVLGYAVAGICTLFVLAVIVFGLKATIDKPASKKPPAASKSAALSTRTLPL
jgi:hypothetical protein